MKAAQAHAAQLVLVVEQTKNRIAQAFLFSIALSTVTLIYAYARAPYSVLSGWLAIGFVAAAFLCRLCQKPLVWQRALPAPDPQATPLQASRALTQQITALSKQNAATIATLRKGLNYVYGVLVFTLVDAFVLAWIYRHVFNG